MKTRYEYEVVAIAKDGFPVDMLVETRSTARKIKNDFVNIYGCTKAKIIQRVYKLTDERIVR